MKTVKHIIAVALRVTPATFAVQLRQEIGRAGNHPKLLLARDFADMCSRPMRSEREAVIESMVDVLCHCTVCVGSILEAARRVTEPSREAYAKATHELVSEVFANL